MATCSSLRGRGPDPLLTEVRQLLPSHVHKLGNILQTEVFSIKILAASYVMLRKIFFKSIRLNQNFAI